MSEIGALSLRIQETGGQAVVERLLSIDAGGKDASAALQQVTVAMKGVSTATPAIASAATEVAKWTGTQKELAKEVAEGTRLFQLQAQTVDVTSKTAVQELRSSAAAQREWLREVGASTEGQLKFGAAVQTFERKVTAAENAQKRMTSQSDKQTTATQAVSGSLLKANGEVTSFGKAGLRAVNGLAFAFSQMANQGEASLRSLAGQLTSVLSLLGKGGAIASIASTVGLAIFDVIRANQKRAIDRMALESQTASRADLTRQKAAIDLTDAAQQAGYQQGLTTLRMFYDQRAQIIAARTAAEIASREKQVAAAEREAEQRLAFVRVAGKDLPDALRGDTLKQADQLRAQATQLRAEIDALGKQGQAETIANSAARAAAEKALAEQVLGFETRRLDAQGQGHRARMAQVEMEVSAYEELLTKQGLNEEHRALALTQYRTALVQQAQLERNLTQIATARQTLDTRRASIQDDLVSGMIDERQAAEQTMQAERDALPAMQDLVGQALALAAALGDEGALAAVRALKQELDGLGRDKGLDDLDKAAGSKTAGASIKAARAEIERRLAADPSIKFKPTFEMDLENLKNLSIAADQQFQTAFLGIADVLGDTLGAAFSGGLGSAGDVLLKGLGGIFMQMGKALLTYGLAMQGLLPALLNPFTSGPAAIAAGTALIALGGLLGGLATGKGSSGGGSSRTAQNVGAPGDGFHLVINDPSRRSAAGRALSGSASSPAAGPTIQVIGVDSPQGQRLIGMASQHFTRRGGF